MTAEQLEASRAERMRQNGHGAVTIEDIRTWIEETGLCIFLPRSAQAGFTAPTFVEAIAGQRTTEPTLELISTAESLLVRLEAEGVAVRLNLSGQPGDQPDYVVAGWVLPYIYALRGDRDWRRSPQLTGSRQVSPLAVQAAKQIDTGNQNAMQIRDALGREVTETAVLRALHELWKQLRIIPVVSEVGQPALWQPLRQRFQKAIAEGASTSQVTAISVLASIYLQAVVAASMEDVEMFLSPLTSRSKIREVVRGLAATRQVHTTNLGSSPLFYVAGTLPEFPVAPSFQISTSFPPYRGSSYLGLDRDAQPEEEPVEFVPVAARATSWTPAVPEFEAKSTEAETTNDDFALPPAKLESSEPLTARQKPLVDRAHRNKRPAAASAPIAASSSKPSPAPRPRAVRSPISGRTATPAPRDRSRNAAASSDSRSTSNGDRRRAPAPRGATSNSPVSRTGSGSRQAASTRTGSVNGSANRGSSDNFNKNKNNGFSKSNGNHGHMTNGAKANGHTHNGNGHNGNGHSLPKTAGNGQPAGRPSPGAAKSNLRSGTASPAPRGGSKYQGNSSGMAKSSPKSSNGSNPRDAHKPAPGKAVSSRSVRPAASSKAASSKKDEREPVKASAAKRYSFSGQSPKSISRRPATASSRSAAKPSPHVGKASSSKSASSGKRTATVGRSADTKRRG